MVCAVVLFFARLLYAMIFIVCLDYMFSTLLTPMHLTLAL